MYEQHIYIYYFLISWCYKLKCGPQRYSNKYKNSFKQGHAGEGYRRFSKPPWLNNGIALLHIWFAPWTFSNFFFWGGGRTVFNGHHATPHLKICARPFFWIMTLNTFLINILEMQENSFFWILLRICFSKGDILSHLGVPIFQ